MARRLLFDIRRFIMIHREQPSAIMRRAFHFISQDILRRTFFSYWVSMGILFQKKFHTCPIQFDGNSVYVQTKANLFFRYDPGLRGGIFNAEFGGVWEHHELFLLRKYTPSRGTFIDVGANFGPHSISLAHTNNARVHAFEPNGKAYDMLVSNIAKNLMNDRITANKLAVGERSGVVLFANTDYFGSHIKAMKEEDVETVKVHMTSLDDYVRQKRMSAVDTIKSDIEGAELFVLKGAMKTIARFRPSVLVEIHEDLNRQYGYVPMDIFSFFSSFGYGYYRITGQGVRKPAQNMQETLRTSHNFFFYSKE